MPQPGLSGGRDSGMIPPQKPTHQRRNQMTTKRHEGTFAMLCPKGCESSAYTGEPKKHFCGTCGTKMIHKCPECEAKFPLEYRTDSTRFCKECGKEIIKKAPPPVMRG